MTATISMQIKPMLDELTERLTNERFTPGTFQQVAAGDFVVTFRPTGEEDEQLLLVQGKGLPPAALAGSVVDLISDNPDDPSRLVRLDRRGGTFVTGLLPGSYRLRFSPRPREQRLPEPSHEPAETAFDAASETLLVQPLELSHGRLYWTARPNCLVVLWQPTRRGAGGSARVSSADGRTDRDAPLLIPVAPKHQIVEWPSAGEGPPADVRLQFEGTDDTVVVPAAWFKSGIRYLAATLYDIHIPTLAAAIERLEADLRKRLDVAVTAVHDDKPTVSRAWGGFWVAEPISDYVFSGASEDETRPPRRVPMNTPERDNQGNIRLRLQCDDNGNIKDDRFPKPVPYAAVLVEAVERSTGQILGSKLVALPLYHGPQGKYRSVVIPLGDIAGDADPKQFQPRVSPAIEDNLPKFREHMDRLNTLIASPAVSNNEELTENLNALKQRLSEVE